MNKPVVAKEWSLWIGNYCLGIARGNNNSCWIVVRYPTRDNGEINTFYPLWNYNES